MPQHIPSDRYARYDGLREERERAEAVTQPDPTPTTVYKCTDELGFVFETESAAAAQELSRHGWRVTATTGKR